VVAVAVLAAAGPAAARRRRPNRSNRHSEALPNGKRNRTQEAQSGHKEH
jgi:hypothetical protein